MLDEPLLERPIAVMPLRPLIIRKESILVLDLSKYRPISKEFWPPGQYIKNPLKLWGIPHKEANLGGDSRCSNKRPTLSKILLENFPLNEVRLYRGFAISAVDMPTAESQKIWMGMFRGR